MKQDVKLDDDKLLVKKKLKKRLIISFSVIFGIIALLGIVFGMIYVFIVLTQPRYC